MLQFVQTLTNLRTIATVLTTNNKRLTTFNKINDGPLKHHCEHRYHWPHRATSTSLANNWIIELHITVSHSTWLAKKWLTISAHFDRFNHIRSLSSLIKKGSLAFSASFHEINSHEINCHHSWDQLPPDQLSWDQLPPDQLSWDQLPSNQLSRDQLATRSTLTRSLIGWEIMGLCLVARLINMLTTIGKTVV